jgi:copper resistance protein C
MISSRRFRSRAAFAALLAATALMTMPTAASAHSELVSTDPEADSTVAEAPDQVALTFNEPVQEQGSTIVVTAGSDVISQAGSFGVDQTTATVALEDTDASGTVQVAYRVVSEDGHVVRDTYTFEIAGPATSSTTGTPTATAEPSPVSNESSDDSNDTIVWVLGLGAIGLVLVAALIAVAVRGRRGPSS